MPVQPFRGPMNNRLISKIKTALRLAANKTKLSRHINYIGHINLTSNYFALPLGGCAQGLENLLLLQPSFKTDLLRIAESVANTHCFIDIGANTGQTMLEYFSYKRNGSYYGFEPNPNAYFLLQELKKLNSLNAHLMPWGCSDNNQPNTLYILSDLDSSATVDKQLRPDQQRTPLHVAEYTFDSIAQDSALPANFIAKIDVEGAEINVLRGMFFSLKTHRPLILCEVLHAHSQQKIDSNNKNKYAIENILTQFQYGLYACVLDRENRLSKLQKIKQFPRNLLYEKAPNSVDFIFCPVELEDKLMHACGHTKTL